MAHEGDSGMEKMVAVEFEPAHHAMVGGKKMPLAPKEALKNAFYDALHYAVEKGGEKHSRCYVYRPERDDTHLRMVVPERLVEDLRAQPFVGREGADPARSTLKILPPG